jgi:FMNH2-dependent dimethyl sulfone monooxygenase
MKEECTTPAGPLNPVLDSGNRLKLGLFCTNMVSALTTAPELSAVTWPNLLRVAREADDLGLEAIVSVARWKGYLASFSHVSNTVYDSFTYAAAIAQATNYSTIISTTHAPTVHPVFVAKQAATIDHIAGGRFALNIVGGWNQPEFDMFGLKLSEHDDRYAYLEEWLALVRRLWTANDAFDYDSPSFTMRGALSLPQPVQERGIPIMNAGFSERGRAFAVEHSELCLIALFGEDPDGWRRQVDEYKKFAREQGRNVSVWTVISIAVRDSTDEAEDYLRRIGVELFDEAAADGFLATQAATNPNVKGELLRQMREMLRVPGPGTPISGSPPVVAERLQALSDAGVDGAIVTYADFSGELARLKRDVLPLLEEAGLREPRSAKQGARHQLSAE